MAVCDRNLKGTTQCIAASLTGPHTLSPSPFRKDLEFEDAMELLVGKEGVMGTEGGCASLKSLGFVSGGSH
jgi:hypothetical protein